MTSETKISLSFSFVSGFIDTVGFITLFNLFTAHITGNLVLAGASIVARGELGNVAGKLIMLPVFLFSVALTCYLMKYKNVSIQKLVLIESLFISCFGVSGAFLLDNIAEPGSDAISVTASFAVVGMGMQNTFMRKSLSGFTPNTVMTGNYTQLSIDLFDLLDWFFWSKRHNPPKSIQPVVVSLKKISMVLFGFFSGCMVGALLVKSLGFVSCALPVMVLLWTRRELKFIVSPSYQHKT